MKDVADDNAFLFLDIKTPLIYFQTTLELPYPTVKSIFWTVGPTEKLSEASLLRSGTFMCQKNSEPDLSLPARSGTLKNFWNFGYVIPCKFFSENLNGRSYGKTVRGEFAPIRQFSTSKKLRCWSEPSCPIWSFKIFPVTLWGLT